MIVLFLMVYYTSLPAWGEWIEIFARVDNSSFVCCLSPHGESGLKWIHLEKRPHRFESLPAWGEWIEIARLRKQLQSTFCLSPHGESGLKFSVLRCLFRSMGVSPRMGRVD